MMCAKDILPDAVSESSFNGVPVRKGSVGAFLVNARELEDPASADSARDKAREDIALALPALRAPGLFDILEIRNEAFRDFIANH
jgi:hypothetical protein